MYQKFPVNFSPICYEIFVFSEICQQTKLTVTEFFSLLRNDIFVVLVLNGEKHSAK